ncbi:MAG: DNA cytosine methyltransferase [Lachnospiraceae bacterium]|nr:DNA cytosine methyltransferase [Lachnospiraceae bacterium]
MGYKKAGFEVLGNVELDERINAVYVKNQHPKYNFCMDLREFNQIPDEKIPEELFNLDILDGSPPCSTFSMVGNRELDWGKEKKFTEGQKKQRLDDLFFVFLETVKKLNPKIVVAENVKGLILKNARGYVNAILNGFRNMGYDCQLFLLNSAYMDVPQSRERVFFIANRCKYPNIKLSFKRPVIPFGKVRTAEGREITSPDLKKYLKFMTPSDRSMADIISRKTGRNRRFSDVIVQDHYVSGTVTSGGSNIRGFDKSYFSDGDFINVQTFPQDYDFQGESAEYICGMSVPPNMMAHIALEIWRQWLSYEKECVEK